MFLAVKLQKNFYKKQKKEVEEPKAEPKFEQAEEKEEESGLQDYSDKGSKNE